MIVSNQKNVKVHLATTEIVDQGIAAIAGKSNYNLGTAYPFVKSLFNNGKLSTSQKGIIKTMSGESRHYVLDSGLFTLMFGAEKGIKDEKYIEKWWECLTNFVLMENYNGTMVEVDCQKVLGPKKAWELRERMREKVPNRIINVFHIEDGQKGLDRLIEFSDYIALSVPELRFAGKKKHLEDLAHYVKNKKPEIDIHLLGCTEKKLLKNLNFCSSADSSSWISGIRYGVAETRAGKSHIDNVKKEVIDKNKKEWIKAKNSLFPNSKIPKNMNKVGLLTFLAGEFMSNYSIYAGPQN